MADWERTFLIDALIPEWQKTHETAVLIAYQGIIAQARKRKDEQVCRAVLIVDDYISTYKNFLRERRFQDFHAKAYMQDRISCARFLVSRIWSGENDDALRTMIRR